MSTSRIYVIEYSLLLLSLSSDILRLTLNNVCWAIQLIIIASVSFVNCIIVSHLVQYFVFQIVLVEFRHNICFHLHDALLFFNSTADDQIILIQLLMTK
ncbi:unnamed protein product [Rotaria socialis]